MNLEIPAEMSNLALWTAIVSFFAPLVLDLIIQSGWNKRVQSLVAFLASAVIGVVTAFFSGAFNGVGIVTGILLAFVVTISAYKGFWKQVVPELKAATSANTVQLDQGDDGTYR
ncbi:membrane protein [Microbacterium phage Hager]|nr:membrane protein [Microbacterium phage Hager]